MSETPMPLWEVFIRNRSGLPHKHAGSVHAPDAAMALQAARDVYTRRGEAVSIWVVPSSAITASDPAREGRAVRADRQQDLPPPDILQGAGRSRAYVSVILHEAGPTLLPGSVTQGVDARLRGHTCRMARLRQRRGAGVIGRGSQRLAMADDAGALRLRPRPRRRCAGAGPSAVGVVGARRRCWRRTSRSPTWGST